MKVEKSAIVFSFNESEYGPSLTAAGDNLGNQTRGEALTISPLLTARFANRIIEDAACLLVFIRHVEAGSGLPYICPPVHHAALVQPRNGVATEVY